MDDRSSRRDFLRWIGASSGALLLSNFACNGSAQNPDTDAGRDAGNEDVGAGDIGSSDGGTTADVAELGGTDVGGTDVGGTDVAEPACEATGSDILGPFHEEGAPHRTVLATEDERGERLVIEGTVYEPDCTTPVGEALLDVWQADADGEYHGGSDDQYRLRGQMRTDSDGRYRFETIRPGNYPLGATMRPAHIHFTVTKPGFEPLTTQLYFAGDPHLAPDDPCGSCNSGDPTLIIELDDDPEGEGLFGTFDIVVESA